MAEGNFTPEGFARTMGSREIGAKRIDPILGRLESLTHNYAAVKDYKSADEQRDAHPHTPDESPDKPFNSMMRKQAEEQQKDIVQADGGMLQGQFENAIKTASNNEEKMDIQKKYKKQMKLPKNPKTTEALLERAKWAYKGAEGDFKYATPIETIFDIATVENQLFDSIRTDMTNKGEIANPSQLTPENHARIQERIDAQLRQIGMNYLRGITLPRFIGQAFLDKAISDAYKLVTPPRPEK